MKKIKASKWIEKSDGVKLIDQFRQIASINYACQAKNILEKVLWSAIFLIGMLYAIYFTAQMFDGNSSIISRIDVKLSDLNYPAMTICPLGSTKYAIAERLGNYLDENSDFVEKFPSLKEITSCIIPLTSTDCRVNFLGFRSYYEECLKPRKKHIHVPVGCKVNFYLQKTFNSTLSYI